MPAFKALFATTAFFAFSMAAAHAQGGGAAAAPPQSVCGGAAQPHCNGISVGMPKVFDNRSLTLQIEALQKVLRQQQSANSTVDLKSVMAALANTQGLTQSELSTVLSVLGNPTPSTGLTTDLKTGNVDTNGNALPDTKDIQTSKNVASVTPTAPTFDSFATLPAGFNPTFGPSASDLLNDQVNLNYQIMNLQMVLERALSDRLISGCEKPSDANPRPNCTRLQTVLGFNVTIDPPRVANDAVAVVEVTLKKNVENSTSQQATNQDLSLVSVMPQEKTYNSAALSSSSHAFSGAAVVNAFQVSGGFRKRNQVFYVYRDTDTLAYERMTESGELVFGWMFRPVLGRRSITPGLRQLLAVVSLPRIDCDHRQISTDSACQMELVPTVRTYWKKYDRATQTSFEKHDANRARDFWYGLTAELSRPQIFSRDSYVNAATYRPLNVYSSAAYEEELRPTVQTVTWHTTGEKTALVSVTGRNFFTNTQVRLGDTTYSEDNKNLIIKSDESFDLITTTDQLTAGPGSILGRYGLSVPIVQYGFPAGATTIRDGFRIVDPQVGPAIDGYRTLDVSLVKRQGAVGQYLADQSTVALLDRQFNARTTETAKIKADLDAKQKQLNAGNGSRRPASAQLRALQDNVTALTSTLIQAQKSQEEAKKARDDARAMFYQNYALTRGQLPYSQTATRNFSLLMPIISVNGTAIRMPNEIYDVAQNSDIRVPQAHVKIHASFSDSLVTKGAALIQVSWPFYDPDHWTDTNLFRDADDQFKVDRVSAKTILIRREGGPGFDPVGDGKCWKFVASDTSVQLATLDCPYAAKTTPKPVKGKPAPKADPGPVLQGLRDIASVTVGDKETLPSHAVLLAPDAATYHLTIPDFPDKKADTADKPVAMKQGDSTWIKITLPAGKRATSVEANGRPLPPQQWRELKPETSASSASKDTPSETIEVEITRTLTIKSGSIDVSVLDASGISVKRQTIIISCDQCSDKKGDK